MKHGPAHLRDSSDPSGASVDALRYRMRSAPTEAFALQVGWIYEQRPCRRKGFVKLRLVDAGGRPFSTCFEFEVPEDVLAAHFVRESAA